MDCVKHFLQSFCPEYGLEKKASLRLHDVQIVAAGFITLLIYVWLNKGYTCNVGKAMALTECEVLKKRVVYSWG